MSEDPPRPPDGSTLQQEMAGYAAARGDFGVEYDDYAELYLREMDFSDDDDQLDTGVCVAALCMITVMFNLTGLNYFRHFPSSLPYFFHGCVHSIIPHQRM